MIFYSGLMNYVVVPRSKRSADSVYIRIRYGSDPTTLVKNVNYQIIMFHVISDAYSRA